MLGLSDFPQTAGHAIPDSQFAHTEPLVVAPSAAPSLVSGSDIPIVPLTAAGSLSMLNATGEVRPLEDMENEIIRFAISHYRGQMSEVARRLKIGRSTLYRKLDEAVADDPAEGGGQDAN
jgi:DNA-binding NtrC family response regulator